MVNNVFWCVVNLEAKDTKIFAKNINEVDTFPATFVQIKHSRVFALVKLRSVRVSWDTFSRSRMSRTFRSVYSVENVCVEHPLFNIYTTFSSKIYHV